ncbi:MAG: tRNA (adenosine(37)-N6)-threonylcarbamoyltransferase complex ATPase subunit type 1 TsaE [Candidatus Pacebacteria bacterium]|nr:tRNA (adenosine(37)-N6)-threonylcarbamoyltransferase complex ATPase subunit type 1 TsaE [Candidatus Paceibacterota bacterium]MBP9851989.1 tRNA (adenosine(37)-N6)-threonylcarbamoyltransferase complex ATPase subunit type 1 TsaE [Candidatus Paceibacterota bacterium]
MELETKKGSDFSRVAVALRSTIEDFKSDSATIVALWGDLGAGKTTLTQYLAKSYGIDAEVVSPTFVIMKIYPFHITADGEHVRNEAAGKFEQLIHIDAYRFENPEEASGIRLHEYIADPKNLILIEWPELLGDRLPDRRIDVKIEHNGEGRKVRIEEQK